MKKLSFILLVSLFSCTNKPTKQEKQILTKDYKYEIHGTVLTVHGVRKATWFTDTISFSSDTIYYFNTDGSKVEIVPPYKINCKTNK